MSPENESQTTFTLPFRTLIGVWCILLATFLVAAWLAAGAGVPSGEVGSALIGSLVALGIGALSILVIRPWSPKASGDLPTIWLFVTVARLFATPVFALLIYFAARLPTGSYVLGIGAAYIALLFLETAVIIVDMRRQFTPAPKPRNSDCES